MNSHDQVCGFMDVFLKGLQDKLIEKGVDKSIVEEVFNGSVKISTPSKLRNEETITRTRTIIRIESSDDTSSSKNSSAEEEHIPIRRMLRPNTDTSSENISSRNSNEQSKSEYTPTEKMPQDFGDKVIIVKNYGPYSHALFGEFDKRYASFKDSYLKNQTWLGYNTGLKFGKGWTVKKKEKLPELQEALDKSKIKYRVIEREDYIKEINSKDKKEVKTNTNTEKPVSKEIKIEKRAEPIEKSDETKKKINKNKWGNYEEAQSGFVLTKLPVGNNKKILNICIGYQDKKSRKEGIDSVIALDQSLIEEAKSNGHKCLNEDMMQKLEDNDKDLYEKINRLWIESKKSNKSDEQSLSSDEDSEDKTSETSESNSQSD